MASVHRIGQIRQGFIPRRCQLNQLIPVGIGQAVARANPTPKDAVRCDLAGVIELNRDTQGC